MRKGNPQASIQKMQKTTNAQEYEYLKDIVVEMQNVATGITVLLCCRDELRDFNDTSFDYLLDLTHRDLYSLIDDIQRTIEGRCSIRDAAFEVLRPPISWVGKVQPDEYDHVPISDGGAA